MFGEGRANSTSPPAFGCVLYIYAGEHNDYMYGNLLCVGVANGKFHICMELALLIVEYVIFLLVTTGLLTTVYNIQIQSQFWKFAWAHEIQILNTCNCCGCVTLSISFFFFSFTQWCSMVIYVLAIKKRNKKLDIIGRHRTS